MKKIALASILKTVDEPRMYQKIGATLASQRDIKVHLIGFQPQQEIKDARIHFHPLFKFSRLNMARILAPLKVFKVLVRIKADILIISTHELLWAGMFYKLLYGKKLYYDVQENYYLNILHTDAFPAPLKTLIAAYVRIKERIVHLFIDHYLLAEQCYSEQMPWVKSKCTVLENKSYTFKKGHKANIPKPTIEFLYSGTIAAHYGIFEAIELIKKLYQKDKNIRLTIIGFAAQKEILSQLKAAITDFPFIRLIGGEFPVSPTEIQKGIKEADYGLLPYQFNRSTQNRVPTKFFEYAAQQLPMICSPHLNLHNRLEHYQAGIVIDFQNYDAEKILEQLRNRNYYKQATIEDLLWEHEAPKLLEVLKG
jgi:glycosyltransferase involved in cell wall biosynthesis